MTGQSSDGHSRGFTLVNSIGEADNNFADLIGLLTYHLRSAQSLLNRHSWRLESESPRHDALLRAEIRVATLQEENRQLRATLETMAEECASDKVISWRSLSSKINDANAVSLPQEKLDIVPAPPTNAGSSIPQPPCEPPALVDSSQAFLPGQPEFASDCSELSEDDDEEMVVPELHGVIPAASATSPKKLSLPVTPSHNGNNSTLSKPGRDEAAQDQRNANNVVDQQQQNHVNQEGRADSKNRNSKKGNFVTPTLSERNTRKEFSSFGEMVSSMFVDDVPAGVAGSIANDGVATGTAPKAVFADAAAMKEQVRQAIGKPEYNVCDFYWEEGFSQWVARSQRFEQFTLMIIGFNSIWIAFDADHNDAAVLSAAPPLFQIAEYSFCLFFVFEWCVRFGAFQKKRDGCKDFWFLFDSLLVLFMIAESVVLNVIFSLSAAEADSGGVGNTSSLKLLRLFRLTRMARMVRLLKAMPELMILIKGMAVAMRSVFFTLCLLGIIVYLFGLAFRQMTDGLGIGDKYFASVPDSMLTLLLRGTLPDVADFVYEVADAHAVFGIFLLFFILFASLTVMNMLVGVLCEVVSVVSSVEKEQLVVSFVQTQLLSVLQHCRGDTEKPMSKCEFTELLGRPQAARALHEVGVDVLGLMEISDFLFKDDHKLSFPDFMEMVLELRGSNTATVKHIVDLQKFVHLELKRTKIDMEAHVSETMSNLGTPCGRKTSGLGIPAVKTPSEDTFHATDSQIEQGRAAKLSIGPKTEANANDSGKNLPMAPISKGAKAMKKVSKAAVIRKR